MDSCLDKLMDSKVIIDVCQYEIVHMSEVMFEAKAISIIIYDWKSILLII